MVTFVSIEPMRTLLVASLFGCAAWPTLAGDALLQRAHVKKALAYIEPSQEKTHATQVTIAEVPAPTHERQTVLRDSAWPRRP